MGFAALKGYPVKNNEVSFKFCEHPKFRSKFYTDREYNSFILRVLVRVKMLKLRPILVKCSDREKTFDQEVLS